jgi:hypothetical protein
VSTPGVSGPERAQHLARLRRLTDVVYGLVILELFLVIPTPDTAGSKWLSVGDYLSEHGLLIAVVLIGLGLTVVYWLQSVQLFAVLEATDAAHSTLSIFQLFFLLAFLYSMILGVELGGSPGTWAFESCMATAVGLCSALAFARATRNGRLLRADVSAEQARQMTIRYRAEPITTGITIPFAFLTWPQVFGVNVAWEFSWFIYPLVVAVVNRFARPGRA